MLTHFVVSDDVARSRRFCTDVPGGKTAMEGEPPVAALANNRIIINTRGGQPTTSQASPSRTSRPRTRWPHQPRGHSNHIQVAQCLPRDPRGVGLNEAGRWSSIAAEHLLCTGGDPLELKPRLAHIGIGSCATAVASDHHAARLVFQSTSVLPIISAGLVDQSWAIWAHRSFNSARPGRRP
jgi:hypothetical protein